MVSRMPSPHRSEDLTVHRFGRTEADAPTLLLLHGLTDSGRCWPDAVARWQDDYRVLAWDARGHGESERFTDQELAAGVGETHLADVVDVLETLRDEGTPLPVLVGLSMGGGTAAAVAGARPDLLRATVLEDPVLGGGRFSDELAGAGRAPGPGEAGGAGRSRGHPRRRPPGAPGMAGVRVRPVA